MLRPGLLLLVGIFCLIPSIRSETIVLHDGSSFVHYIDLNGGELKQCMLSIKPEKISLYPNNIQNAVNPVKYQMQSFEKRACGFKLYNFNQHYAYQYNLTATILKAGATFEVKKSLDVKPFTGDLKFTNVSQEVQYGDKQAYIKTCAIPSGNKGYCSLYSPDGVLVQQSHQSCGHTLEYVVKEHIGAWKCEINISGAVDAFTYYINVVLKKTAFIKTWYKKENGYGILGCQIVDGEDLPAISNCGMLTPGKQLLNIEQYSASGRYDSFGTNYSQRTCQIEFKLPALSNETGTWVCQLGVPIANPNAGFINVEKGSVYAKSQKLLTRIGDSPWIHCQVPYSASSAYSVDPSGAVNYVASRSEALSGELSFPLHTLTEADFGEWACHFAKNNSYDDDVIKVTVERFDAVHAKIKDVDVDEGDDLVILFTANGAISYCAIEDPRGNIYHIQQSTKSPNLEYYGAGFAQGECGIRVKHVTEMHEGMWKCMTNTVAETVGDRQATARTRVEVTSHGEGVAIASSSSILIGIVFAVLVAMALVVYGKFLSERGERRRARERPSPANSIGDENSETSFVLHHL